MPVNEVAEAVLAYSEHEHRDLSPGIARIHAAGCAVGRRLPLEARLQVRDVLRWADDVLEPHMAWEESWLYPRIEVLTGTAWSTRAARYDHLQVRDAIEQLRDDERQLTLGLSHAVEAEVGARLFGLEAVLRAHVEREEELLQPVLVDAPRTRLAESVV